MALSRLLAERAHAWSSPSSGRTSPCCRTALPSFPAGAGSQLGAQASHGLFEMLASQAEGHVAARLLDDAARQVRLPAQTVGDGVRIVHRDQHGVDVVHDRKQAFGLLRVSVPQNVQRLAAQLADDFGQTIQVCGARHPQLLRRGKRLVLDQGAGHIGFDEFLQCVLGVSGVVQVRVIFQALGQGLGQAAGLGKLLLHGCVVVPVHGADGQRAGACQLTRLSQRLVAAGRAAVEVVADLLRDAHQLVHAAPQCELNSWDPRVADAGGRDAPPARC